jgi:hypothetical protein
VAHTVILATKEVESRKIVVQGQPREIVHKTLSQKRKKKKNHKKGGYKV